MDEKEPPSELELIAAIKNRIRKKRQPGIQFSMYEDKGRVTPDFRRFFLEKFGFKLDRSIGIGDVQELEPGRKITLESLAEIAEQAYTRWPRMVQAVVSSKPYQSWEHLDTTNIGISGGGIPQIDKVSLYRTPTGFAVVAIGMEEINLDLETCKSFRAFEAMKAFGVKPRVVVDSISIWKRDI